jgi:putative ABC transport system permease protein
VNEARWLGLSERWLRLLVRLYPPDFRDEMGEAVIEAYRDRCRAALRSGGVAALTVVWARALMDSLRNGPGERARPAASWRRSGNWGRDIELAWRRLVRAPVFAFATVGTLAVGLGAFAVVFTAVHRVLLQPMPYDAPEDLYYVWRDYRAIFDLDRGWVSGPDIVELQGAGGAIQDAVGLQRNMLTLTDAQDIEATEVPVMYTTPNLFEVLGVRPALGRVFAEDETGTGRTPLVVLTHELWQRLGGRQEILGTSLRLNGTPFEVIGVMPEGFNFMRNASLGPPQAALAYATLAVNLAELSPGAGSYAVLVRARPGTSPEQVTTAVTEVGRRIDERDFESRGLKLYPLPLHGDLVAKVRPALVILGAAGAFLLLVLLVNLATLLLARSAQREQEFAVSRALGANPSAVMRAHLLEGTLLGMIGGIVATGAAIWGTRTLVALAPLDLPRRTEIAVGWDIAAIVIGAGALLGFLAALVPAIWSSRSSLAVLLRAAAVRGGGGHERMRRGMVVAQVALSLLLLSAGALVVRSFEQLLRADPGFTSRGVLTARVPLPVGLFPDSIQALAMQDRIEEALARIPGAEHVGSGSTLPMTASVSQSTFQFPGAPGNTGNEEVDAPLIDYWGVRAGYVEALGIQLIEGRSFLRDRTPDLREVMIDEQVARQFWPNTSPVGVTFPFSNQTVTIIGVFRQPRLYDVHADGRPQLLFRAEDWGYRSLSYVVRTRRDARTVIPDLQAAVRSVDPQLAVAEVRTMDEIVGDALREERVSAVLVAGFALGALLLAAMGLFGVVSASVTRRRHELAIRLALGADNPRLLRLVMGEGARLIALGILIGVPATWAAGGALRALLVGVESVEALTVSGVAVLLASVALAACYLPARRVLGIQPARLLRD